MKKQLYSVFGMVCVCLLFASGCKKKVAPVSERIAKAWAAELVKEDNITVYEKGASSNPKPGYSAFGLSLNSDKTVRLVEFNNDQFNGVWELQGDKVLILRNLTPEPTGTSGVIEFNIVSIEDKRLNLKRTSTSVKTGGTINDYILSVP